MIDYRIMTFLTLCREMNYRRTAEILNMTQPAVTQHIKYLENLYKCKLFHYDKHTLAMTDTAVILQRYAENMLYQEKKLEELLGAAGGRQLNVGATKTIGEFVIADQVARYLEDNSNRITVQVDNTVHLLKLLSEGKLDFALIEGFFDRRQYASRLYRREPFAGLCGKDHPFAGRTVSVSDLWTENLLIREDGSGTRNILEQLLREQNHSIEDFSRVTYIGNFGLISRILAHGHSISFAYSTVQEGNDAIAVFHVDGWDIVREFNYVFLDNPSAAEAVDYFDSFR